LAPVAVAFTELAMAPLPSAVALVFVACAFWP
jgi:hypothetical protein